MYKAPAKVDGVESETERILIAQFRALELALAELSGRPIASCFTPMTMFGVMPPAGSLRRRGAMLFKR